MKTHALRIVVAATVFCAALLFAAPAQAARIEFYAPDPGDGSVPSEIARWAQDGTLLDPFAAPFTSLSSSVGGGFNNLAFDGTYFYAADGASVARWDAAGNLLEGWGGFAVLQGIGAPLDNLATDGTHFYSVLNAGVARWAMDGTLLNGWGGFATLEGIGVTPDNFATDGRYFYSALGANVARWEMDGTLLNGWGGFAVLEGVGSPLNALAVSVVAPAPAALPAGLALLGLAAVRRRRRR